jgi:integrase
MRYMQKEWSLINLFEQFIRDCNNGKRLKKDGKRIKLQTVENYKAVLKLLKEFEVFDKKKIILFSISGNNKRHLTSERNRWKKFYMRLTNFLYKQKECYDNYVGNVIKTIRVFCNYLKIEKFLPIGDFYKQFYVYKEEIPIITLLPEQLYFLINNIEFDESLNCALKRSKDIFVFGCTVGLRFSDLMNIRFTDMEKVGDIYYLNTKSKKTEIVTKVKLPGYVLKIIHALNRKAQKRTTVIPLISKNQFNKNIKRIAEKAGWTHDVPKRRTKRGKEFIIYNCKSDVKKIYRFCDLLSSHVMRRTAVSTMLMLGMPEHVVKKVSGHTSDSKAFYRYVTFAQSYLDTHIDKVYDHFSNQNNNKDFVELSR